MKNFLRTTGAVLAIVSVNMLWVGSIMRCALDPLDPITSNYHDTPPVVSPIPDTVVAINDTLMLLTSGSAPNGSITGNRWSFDKGATWQDGPVSGLPWHWAIADTGSRVVYYKAVDNVGIESAVDSFIVIVKACFPTVTAMSDTTVAINDTVLLHAAGTDSGGPVVKYRWSFDAGVTWRETGSGVFRIAWSVPDTGLKFVRVKAVNHDGLESQAGIFRVAVKSYAPTVSLLTDTFVNIKNSANFSATGFDSNGTIRAYHWSIVRNGSPTSLVDTLVTAPPGASFKFLFPDTGRFVVTVTAIDDDSLASLPAASSVHVYISNPSFRFGPDFAVSIDRQPTTIQAQAWDINGTVVKCYWALDGKNFRDSTTATTITHAFADTGVFTVCAYAKDNDSELSKVDTIVIHVIKGVPPVVHAMDGVTVSINQPVTITATAIDTVNQIARFFWALDGVNFMDSTTAGQITTAFADSGIHIVRVFVRNDMGYDSFADSVLIHAVINPPTVQAMADASVKINQAITVTATAQAKNGTIMQYYWAIDGSDFKDSTAAGAFSVTFASLGAHVVYVKVSDNFGVYSSQDTVVITATNGELPVVTGLTPIWAMIDRQVTLTVTGTDADGQIVQYFWALDGKNYLRSTTTGQLAAFFRTAGFDTVLVRARDNDGNYSTPFAIVVNVTNAPLPVVTAMNDTLVDIRKQFMLRATATTTEGTIAGFLWALDGATYKDTTKTGSIPCTSTTGGRHAVYVRAYNSLGSYSLPDSVIVTTKAIAPKVQLTQHLIVKYTNVDSNLALSAVASDSDGTVKKYLWAVDSKVFKDTTDSAVYRMKVTGLGTQVVYVQVMDNDGLLSAIDSCTIAKRTWTPPGTAIAYDTYLVDSIAQKGQQNAYHFSGSAGDHITLRANAIGVGSNGFNTKVELYSPSGVLDTSRWDTDGYYVQQVNFIDFVLRQTGTYTIYVSERDGAFTAKYWLNLQCREQVKANAKAITYDTYIPSDSIAPLGEMTAYTFSGTAGEHITLRANAIGVGSNGFNTKVEIYSPSGVLDTSRWDTDGYHVQQVDFIDFVLKQTGTYTIYVSERDGAFTAKCWLNLQCREQVKANAKTVAYGTTLPADSVSPQGDIVAYTFSGTIGDLITLRIQPSGTSYFHARTQLFNASGTLDTMAVDAGTGSSPAQVSLVDYMLKSTGVFTIYVSDRDGAVASKFSFSLTVK